VIGTAVVKADINYNRAPWKYNGNEVMVETQIEVLPQFVQATHVYEKFYAFHHNTTYELIC